MPRFTHTMVGSRPTCLHSPRHSQGSTSKAWESADAATCCSTAWLPALQHAFPWHTKMRPGACCCWLPSAGSLTGQQEAGGKVHTT